MGTTGADDNHIVDEFLRDEDAFLRRASADEIQRLMDYFRIRAYAALTPEEHAFFIDRATQVALRSSETT